MTTDRLFIDLADIATEDIQILAQEGSRGMTEFAASSGTNCNVPNACSCTVGSDSPVVGVTGRVD